MDAAAKYTTQVALNGTGRRLVELEQFDSIKSVHIYDGALHLSLIQALRQSSESKHT